MVDGFGKQSEAEAAASEQGAVSTVTGVLWELYELPLPRIRGLAWQACERSAAVKSPPSSDTVACGLETVKPGRLYSAPTRLVPFILRHQFHNRSQY
jgi:hypothetical protein